MSSQYKQFAALTLVVTMLVVSGCASMAPDTGNADDTALLGDVLTERKILRAFDNEPGLTGQNIAVACVGGAVTLSGDVNSAVEKKIAEKIASSIDGVTSVSNRLSTN